MREFSIVVGYCIVCIRLRYCERVKRKLQHMCCTLYSFILLDNRKDRIETLFLDVAQIRWTCTYIFVSFVFCFLCILFPHLFILLLHDPIFLTYWSRINLPLPLLYFIRTHSWYWISIFNMEKWAFLCFSSSFSLPNMEQFLHDW